jgi:Lon protease-like protein
MKVPLLPLNAIVCPQGRIPLQVFEPQYLDMVAEALRTGKGFVTVLLNDEKTPQEKGEFYRLGTLVSVVDFGKTASTGVLNITVEGEAQVVLSNLEIQADGLWLADVSEIYEEGYVDLPDEFEDLRVVLQALMKHPFVKELNMEIDYQDGRQVGWRLTELLPLCNKEKQCLYEMTDAISRLEKISEKISDMVS